MTLREPDEGNTLRFERIERDLDALQRETPTAVEKSQHPSLKDDPLLRAVLITQARLAGLTLDAIRLAAAARPSDHERTPFILAALSPLVRELLDQVFTLAFLFEDLPNRWLQFKKGGWRDLKRHNEVIRRHESEAAWLPYIEGHSEFLRKMKIEAHVTEEEIKVGGKVRWPNPGAMKDSCPPGALKDYLTHLDEWFYRELSQSSHAQLIGILDEASFLAVDQTLRGRDKVLFIELKRALVAFRGIGLTLAVFSELEIALHLSLAETLLSVWRRSVAFQPEIAELFAMRYEPKLGGSE